MSFLAPFFLLGSLAVALPIVFHLIRRTSRERIPFSSLMFLAPTPPRVTRRSRLEHLFLLLLRCLALCILALGFARPFFQKPINTNPASKESKRIVILIDSSASMRREGLWDQAKAKAEAILRQTTPADLVAVYAFDMQPRQVIGFDRWVALGPGERVGFVQQRLAEIQPSWSNTHLGNALITAAEAFEQSNERKLGQRQIVLISDMQEGSRLDGLEGFEWPRGVSVFVETLRAKRPTNAGLFLVQENDETTQTSTNAQMRVRVTNSSDAKKEQFRLEWENASGAAPVSVYVPAGQSRIVPVKIPDSTTVESLHLTGDDDEFDNRLYVVPPKKSQFNVLYLGNDREDDPADLLYYLRRAFQETKRLIVQVHSRRMDAVPTSSEIENADLLVVSSVLTENHREVLKQILNRKKTVLLVGKDTATAENIGRALGLGSITVQEATGGNYAMLGEISFTHPLFLNFADPRFSDFTKIHFWKHRRLNADDVPGARVIAKFDNGDPALLEASKDGGTVLLLLSGWHPADSQLALSSKFVPLLYSMLNLGTDLQPQMHQLLVGETLRAKADPTGQPLKLRKPDGSVVELKADQPFSDTDRPGVYAVESSAPVRFAVNLDPVESKTAPLPLETLERYGIPLKEQNKEQTKEATVKARNLLASEQEQQQQLWRWLVVGALLFLILETWVAGRTMARFRTVET